MSTFPVDPWEASGTAHRGQRGKTELRLLYGGDLHFARVNLSVHAALMPPLVTVTYDNSGRAPKWNFSTSNMAFARFGAFI